LPRRRGDIVRRDRRHTPLGEQRIEGPRHVQRVIGARQQFVHQLDAFLRIGVFQKTPHPVSGRDEAVQVERHAPQEFGVVATRRRLHTTRFKSPFDPMVDPLAQRNFRDR